MPLNGGGPLRCLTDHLPLSGEQWAGILGALRLWHLWKQLQRITFWLWSRGENTRVLPSHFGLGVISRTLTLPLPLIFY